MIYNACFDPFFSDIQNALLCNFKNSGRLVVYQPQRMTGKKELCNKMSDWEVPDEIKSFNKWADKILAKIKKVKEVKEGDEIGGFYISSPWDEKEPLLIKKAIIRNFDNQLWAEHIDPQYDYTEIDDPKYWAKYLLKKPKKFKKDK